MQNEAVNATCRSLPSSLLALALCLFGARSHSNASAAESITVPGTSNPWLAGMPPQTVGNHFDISPDHSPIEIKTVRAVPGSALRFNATGAVKKGPSWPFAGPDGDIRDIAGTIMGSENGIADIVAPKNALLGVFLNSEAPYHTLAPEPLDFASATSRDYLAISPGLKQVFFIGNGLTSSGAAQRVVVPAGATRLFLGTMDGVGWYNNEGSFAVEVLADLPVISVRDVNVTEGNSAAQPVLVPILLSTASPHVVAIEYSTADGTATAGKDYLPIAGIIRFLPGETNQSIAVTIAGDTTFEPDEYLRVQLRSATNAVFEISEARITILNDDSENVPPTVAITQPEDGAVFASGSDLPIEAVTHDPDGSVAHVEFFAGSRSVGSVSSPPFTLAWPNVPAGEFILTAQATDNTGLRTVSAPVRIVIKDLSGDVAVVRETAHPEIDKLEEYLSEMGLSARVLNASEISFELLSKFKLIIWNDLGRASTNLTASGVTALSRVRTNSIPIYFIGENLSSMATNFNETVRARWTSLVRLQTDTGKRSTAQISMLDTANLNPITQGPFGTVQTLTYPNQLERASIADMRAQVFGTADGSPVLVGYPGLEEVDNGETRTMAQNFLVYQGGDAASQQERKELFQNVVCWLIRCSACGAVDLNLEVTGPVGAVRVGEPIGYTIVVRHGGECEAAGVIVTNYLPAAARFVAAQSEHGSWRHENGTVVFDLGRLANASETELRVLLVPTTAGMITNVARVRLNGPEVTTANNTAEAITTIQDVTRPLLSIEPITGESFRVSVLGFSDQLYSIEASTDLREWKSLTNVPSASGQIDLVDPSAPTFKQRFYRIVSRAGGTSP